MQCHNAECEPILLTPDQTTVILPNKCFSIKPNFPPIHESYGDLALQKFDFTTPNRVSGYLRFFRLNVDEALIEILNLNTLQERQILQFPPNFTFKGDSTNSGIRRFFESLPVYPQFTFRDLDLNQIDNLKVQMHYLNLPHIGLKNYEQEELLKTSKASPNVTDWLCNKTQAQGMAYIEPNDEVFENIHWKITI